MFTRTATVAAAAANALRGLGFQPWLLAHSIIARPRQHKLIDRYMMTSATSSGRCAVPRLRARSVSGSKTGGVSALDFGAVAQRPTNAIPARPSALSVTAGSGRARGLVESTLMRRPIRASTRPPGIGGSASFGEVMVGGLPALSRGGGSTRTDTK